jgi:hypothetical protein
VEISQVSTHVHFEDLRNQVRSGKVDDAQLKKFVESAKLLGVSGTELQKAKTELVRRSARADLFVALEGNSYRKIQKKLKRATHWLTKHEIEDARNVINQLQVSRELETVRNSKDAMSIRKTCNKADLVDLPGVDPNDPSLHIKWWDGYSKMEFMPNAFETQFCKDPRCGYLAADKWEFCCGKCQYYYETYGFDPLRPKKRHDKRCWRVNV